ncbi:MAG: DUF2330 domain-containing protein, partial [Sandaracinaceae bacterium]|nr:DUF2330 domain-containing protein [Sandaracinaceae bacterium]
LALTISMALAPLTATAICRVVEPLESSGDPGVQFDPRTAALMILSPDQLVALRCDDGASAREEGVTYVCDDGSVPREERDTLVSFVVQPSIVATGGNAGLIMPVPARPDVHPGSPTLIATAAGLIVPWVQETVRVQPDPSLGFQCSDPHFSSAADFVIAAPSMAYGCGSSDYYRPGTEGRETTSVEYGDAGIVRYESIETTDAYDVTVLNASSLDALRAWLDERDFKHSDEDDAAFGAYLAEDAWFVAVHVHPDSSGARRALDPLVVTWRGSQVPLTHRLQYDSRGGTITTDAFVLAPARLDAADGTAFTEYAAPATFEGSELEGFGLERGWLTRLTMTRIASQRLEDSELVEVEEEELRPAVQRTVHARIAAPCCPGGRVAVRDIAAYPAMVHTRRYLLGESPPIPEQWLGRSDPPGAEWCGAETFGCANSASRPGLRGCASGRIGAVIGGWGPIALALGAVVWRSRKRR